MNKIKNMPKFAVLLAAYNGMEYIADQIESILAQKDVELQIFISVDKSSDGTESYLIDLSSNLERISILTLGDSFGGASQNFYRLIRDVDFKNFDYVCFSDQDDLWYEDKLLRAHQLLSQGDFEGYSSNVNAFWPSGRIHLVDKAQPQKSWDFLFEAAGPGCTYVLKKSLALSVQLLVCNQSNYVLKVGYHDWLIYAFARANNFRWVIDYLPSMDYRQHQNNQIGVNIGWAPFMARARKMLSGHGFSQSMLIAKLVGISSPIIVRYGLYGGRFGYLWLALNAINCRRRGIDQLHFFILCLIAFVLNSIDFRKT